MTKVKICGLKTIKDIQAVNRWKPDFAGFVFAPGKRQITLEKIIILVHTKQLFQNNSK